MLAKIILSWKRTKELRAKILGKKCELCGDYLDILIGHHINGRLRSGKNWNAVWVTEGDLEKFYGWRSCQLRCVYCEIMMHLQNSSGNNHKTENVQDAHNLFIAQALSQNLHHLPADIQGIFDSAPQIIAF